MKAEALSRWPDLKPVLKVREVKDSGGDWFRSALDGHAGILWKANDWDYRTYQADHTLALTRERVLLWADLIAWPYELPDGRPCDKDGNPRP